MKLHDMKLPVLQYANRIKYVRLVDVKIPQDRHFMRMTLVYTINKDNSLHQLKMMITSCLNNPAFVQITDSFVNPLEIINTDWATMLLEMSYGVQAYIASHEALKTYINNICSKWHPRMEVIRYLKRSKYQSWYDEVLDKILQDEAKDRQQSCAAKKIQKTWRQCISNPYHVIGKRRLLREYHEMV